MPPLPQDIAGELGRYITQLKASLDGVREQLGLVGAQIRLENLEAQLLTQLTPQEAAAIDDFLQKLNLAELSAKRDLLRVQRDALIRAIDLLRAQLEAAAPNG